MIKYFLLLIIIFLSTDCLALPQKVYLPIPFLCQAPNGNWSQPWQDACEEAAIIMAMRYVKGESVNRESGNEEILDMVDFQIKNYGGHFDLDAQRIANLIKDYYKYNNVEVRYDIQIEDIKGELAKKNAVIAPMAGRLLGNPYYTPPGPAYHNMLFKGYDDRSGEFITNDPGTRRGRNYRYRYRIAYNAIHDWTGNKKTIAQGKKAMVVVKKLDLTDAGKLETSCLHRGLSALEPRTLFRSEYGRGQTLFLKLAAAENRRGL